MDMYSLKGALLKWYQTDGSPEDTRKGVAATAGSCLCHSQPKEVAALSHIAVRKIASLSTHSVAITDSGALFSWGNGDKFRLGHGTRSLSCDTSA